MIAIRNSASWELRGESISDLNQELIRLTNDAQFIFARRPILLDEDPLSSRPRQRIDKLLPICISLTERYMLREMICDGRRKGRSPFLNMGEFIFP